MRLLGMNSIYSQIHVFFTSASLGADLSRLKEEGKEHFNSNWFDINLICFSAKYYMIPFPIPGFICFMDFDMSKF